MTYTYTVQNSLYLSINYANNMGLCNQLYMLFCGIHTGIKEKKQYVLIDKFQVDYRKNSYISKVPISNILNLSCMNEYLKRYNIELIDYFKLPANIKKTNFPPFVNIGDRAFAPGNPMGPHSPLSAEINRMLRFQYNCIKPAHIFFQNILNKNKSRRCMINIIHLRLEDDAIKHWSKKNNVSPQQYQNKISNAFIENISKYVRPVDITIVLTGETNNNVIQFLRKKRYQYYTLKKTSSNRELNAIQDLYLGKMCNNVLMTTNGSTFSEVLQIFHTNKEIIRVRVGYTK